MASIPPLRRLALLLLGLCAALLLAGCTITSQRPLIAESNGVTPLPDAFVLFPYEQGPDGYLRSRDPPVSFSRVDNHYESADVPDIKGRLAIQFIPAGSDFLLGARETGAPAMTYGFARYADGVLVLWLSPAAATSAAIERARQSAMPKEINALAGVVTHPRTDAITVRNRAALDVLADLFAAGRLPMGPPSVAWLSEDPDATAPTRLVASGTEWIKVP